MRALIRFPPTAAVIALLALPSACTERPTGPSVVPNFWIEIPPVENVPGRMTGGGGNIIVGDVQVTKGFTIHCDIVLSNNLEINWPGNKWHIDKPLDFALCLDDPAYAPTPPQAPFDTFIGSADGELNGEPGSIVEFKFIDGGEPGAGTDLVQLFVFSPGGDLVLEVPLSLIDKGNMQAHEDQPHK